MSSEVKTAVDISGPSSSQRILDFAPNDKDKEATRCLFTVLTIYHDNAGHSAAINMAIDEALLECVTVSAIRFYRWQSPALSFGYFGRFADVAGYERDRDLVRRWTGGGIVFHGTDVTYSVVIPASDSVFAESSTSIYEKIHQALVDALAETGQRAVVAGVGSSAVALAKADDPGSYRTAVAVNRAGISDAGYSCFVNPVRADVIVDGRKIAGAAQRRTRRALLQQGSIQGIDIGDRLAERFAQALSTNRHEREVDIAILNRAGIIAQQKYGTQNWLRKR